MPENTSVLETEPTFISSALDFKKGLVTLAVFEKKLDGTKLVVNAFLVNSNKEKLILDNETLLQHGLFAERQPHPTYRWEAIDMENYLQKYQSANLEKVFNRILDESKDFLDFGDERINKFLALWIIGTYFHPMFATYPYLHLNGNAGSGKTKVLQFISNLSFNGMLSVNSTAAYMIRMIHDNQSTCCIDEVERFEQVKDEETKAVLAMFNSGYKKGATVGKCEASANGKWTLKELESYSPKVFAGIKSIPHTLSSRCIQIVMVKSSNNGIANSNINEESGIWQEIRNLLYRNVLDSHMLVRGFYLGLMDEQISGRSWELWKPILGVAMAVDPKVELYNEMRMLALEYEIGRTELESESVGAITLLSGLREMVSADPRSDETYSTDEIYGFLAEEDPEEFGWLKEPQNQGRRGKWLGNELRRSKVIQGRAIQKRIEGKNTKSYKLSKVIIEERLRTFGHALPTE
jgi:hypothetical protein